MIKKILAATLAILIAFCALANNPADSLQSSTDTIRIDEKKSVNVIADLSTESNKLLMIDGEKFILSNGEVISFDRYERKLNEKDNRDYNAIRHERNLEQMKASIPLFAIGFGAPCLAFVIGVILWVRFLLKRNRERNEIIMKAIDDNYELPEAFYTRQPAFPTYNFSAANNDTDPNDPKAANTTNGNVVPPQLPGMNMRTYPDFKALRTGIVLICIGVPIFLFFACIGEPGVGLLLGGIPFFLGIGKIVTYYAVPSNRNTSRPRFNPPYAQPQPPFSQAPYYRPEEPNFQQPQQGAYPPPYNPYNEQQPYAPRQNEQPGAPSQPEMPGDNTNC